MKLKRGVKWYCDDCYLELYDPVTDTIISISHIGIRDAWYILMSSLSDGISDMDDSDNPKLCGQLLSFLRENHYLESS